MLGIKIYIIYHLIDNHLDYHILHLRAAARNLKRMESNGPSFIKEVEKKNGPENYIYLSTECKLFNGFQKRE